MSEPDGRFGPATVAVDRAIAWFRTRDDGLALALAGSYASGTAHDGSDVDLVVVVEDPQVLLHDDTWMGRLAEWTSWEDEEWGIVTSRRVHHVDTPEVEYGITDRRWVTPPLDAGTAHVMNDGVVVLADPLGLLAGALESLGR